MSYVPAGTPDPKQPERIYREEWCEGSLVSKREITLADVASIVESDLDKVLAESLRAQQKRKRRKEKGSKAKRPCVQFSIRSGV